MEILRTFTQRKRAKDAAIACLLLSEGENRVDIKAYVKPVEEYILRITFTPDSLFDKIEGRTSYGHETDEYLDPDDCIEFYQGEGMGRFRGA